MLYHQLMIIIITIIVIIIIIIIIIIITKMILHQLPLYHLSPQGTKQDPNLCFLGIQKIICIGKERTLRNYDFFSLYYEFYYLILFFIVFVEFLTIYFLYY